jgi:hypothetical protein
MLSISRGKAGQRSRRSRQIKIAGRNFYLEIELKAERSSRAYSCSDIYKIVHNIFFVELKNKGNFGKRLPRTSVPPRTSRPLLPKALWSGWQGFVVP